jgi:hypothetical protein
MIDTFRVILLILTPFVWGLAIYLESERRRKIREYEEYSEPFFN